MQTRVSSRGQIVLPAHLRLNLGIREGDILDIEPGAGSVTLRLKARRPARVRIKPDPISGLPVLSAEGNGPPLTTRAVEDLLHDFP